MAIIEAIENECRELGRVLVQNLFIAGVQKAGTTALHQLLGSHSEVFLSETKELHVFDDESIDWANPSYSALEAAFGDNKVTGEATPVYLYWPNSIERIHRYDHTARIIVLLRHPVFRAHSHWRMETIRGAETLPFSQAIREGRQRVKSSNNGCHRVYSYVERGLYASQIERLLQYFPREQVLFLTTDKLWMQPHASLSKVETFLGLKRELSPEKQYIVSASTDLTDELSVDDYRYLMDIYRSEIEKTQKLTGVFLQNWLNESYREPDKRTSVATDLKTDDRVSLVLSYAPTIPTIS